MHQLTATAFGKQRMAWNRIGVRWATPLACTMPRMVPTTRQANAHPAHSSGRSPAGGYRRTSPNRLESRSRRRPPGALDPGAPSYEALARRGLEGGPALRTYHASRSLKPPEVAQLLNKAEQLEEAHNAPGLTATGAG